ncbi:uncharacterized protein Z518_04325 [Rhinocladiella mackenziei CBS 650.93]|uniref:Uncharacterized protein n=1 Tax=Rhinocladiella mackenziei CBS 650.93 TaxID=1442369 RepID=A0A0D2IKX0_9EURO|nr:uncharacterized protein Z518_04325 [Rhinocladiella mackenziei CBS 650.93]KIX06349.1 hypothetical protein Z518_04325 [Rhinocladiella mackenziei CBS 650.93]
MLPPASQRRFFVGLSDPEDFKNQLRRLDSLIYPIGPSAQRPWSYETLNRDPKRVTASSTAIATESRVSSLRGPTPQTHYNRGGLRMSVHESMMQKSVADDSDDPASPLPDGELDAAEYPRANSDLSAASRLSSGGYGRTHLEVPPLAQVNNIYVPDPVTCPSPIPENPMAAEMDENTGFIPSFNPVRPRPYAQAGECIPTSK